MVKEAAQKMKGKKLQEKQELRKKTKSILASYINSKDSSIPPE